MRQVQSDQKEVTNSLFQEQRDACLVCFLIVRTDIKHLGETLVGLKINFFSFKLAIVLNVNVCVCVHT